MCQREKSYLILKSGNVCMYICLSHKLSEQLLGMIGVLDIGILGYLEIEGASHAGQSRERENKTQYCTREIASIRHDASNTARRRWRRCAKKMRI